MSKNIPQAKNPKLIVFSVLQCSGKSTLATELSNKAKIPVFSVDSIHFGILKAGVKDIFAVGYADYLVAESLARENLIDASNLGVFCRRNQY